MAIKIRMREMFDRLKLTYGDKFSIVESDTFRYTLRIACLDIIVRDHTYQDFMEVSITTVIPTQFCQTHKTMSSISYINIKSIERFIREWADAYIAYVETVEGSVLDSFLCAVKSERIPVHNRTLRAFGYSGLSQFVDVLSGLAANRLIGTPYVLNIDNALHLEFYSNYCFGYSSFDKLVNVWNTLTPKGASLHLAHTLTDYKRIIRITIPGQKYE